MASPWSGVIVSSVVVFAIWHFFNQFDTLQVILKSALVTNDQSSEDEDSEVANVIAEAEEQNEKPPVVNFELEPVQPAVNRLNALDYPEDSGNADSSAPSSLESQSGPASVIIESQEVPTPDSAAFILKTTEQSSLDDLPTPQEPVIEVIPGMNTDIHCI